MIHAILFDAGDILYSKPSRQQAFDTFLLSRGYAASKTRIDSKGDAFKSPRGTNDRARVF